MRPGGESRYVDVVADEERSTPFSCKTPCSGNAGASDELNMLDWKRPLAFGADATLLKNRCVAEEG